MSTEEKNPISMDTLGNLSSSERLESIVAIPSCTGRPTHTHVNLINLFFKKECVNKLS